MSISKFPEWTYEKVNLGSGPSQLGIYTISEYGQFSYIYATMAFYRTDLFNNEQVRMRVQRSDSSEDIFSAYVTPVNDITNFQDTDYWFGNVRFDFERQNLNASTTIKIFLDTLNYSYDLNGTQIANIYNYYANDGSFDIDFMKASNLTLFLYR